MRNCRYLESGTHSVATDFSCTKLMHLCYQFVEAKMELTKVCNSLKLLGTQVNLSDTDPFGFSYNEAVI